MEEKMTPDEFEKLILLMKEYTEKLRSICEERLDARFRQQQSAIILTAAMAAVLSMMLILSQKFGVFHDIFSIIIIIPISIVILLIFQFLFRTSRFRYSYDAERVAATVERLIRLASQYNEHAQKKISNHFELDLRIAEAEGALSHYRKVFAADAEWKSKD